MDTPVGSFEALKPGWSALRGAAAAPVNCFVSSGAEYTPLPTRCQQYIVVLYVLGAIECILPQINADLRKLFPGACIGQKELVIADVAVVTVERGKGVGGLFQHLLGHGDRVA